MHFDALRITQPSGRQVFAFAATADAVLDIAEIARVHRGEDGVLGGYQRPEVASHIAEIRKYLETEDAVLPNTVVIAFDNRVQFVGSGESRGQAEIGELLVPKVGDGDPPSGFVVDGQQRLAAIASSRHPEFPIFVTAVIAPEISEQRRQFVLVNRTKPLPQGLIYELLPDVDGSLPQSLAKQRLASIVTAQLNFRLDSSLYRMIRTPTCPVGMIKDNSVRRMVMNSLTDGALFDSVRDRTVSADEVSDMVKLVSVFWAGVRQTFPEAWGLPPKCSRLSHGVGIMALGYVMDHIYGRGVAGSEWTVRAVSEALKPLAPYCAWTGGNWPFGPGEERHWNELQNTDRDVRVLMNHFRRVLTR